MPSIESIQFEWDILNIHHNKQQSNRGGILVVR
jgi:hypothetical protein